MYGDKFVKVYFGTVLLFTWFRFFCFKWQSSDLVFFLFETFHLNYIYIHFFVFLYM